MGQPDPGAVSSGVCQLPTEQLGQPPSPHQVWVQQHLTLCDHGHPFLAIKGFHPKIEVSLKSVVLEAAHQVTKISRNCICISMIKSLMPKAIQDLLSHPIPPNSPLMRYCLVRLMEHQNELPLKKA